MKQFENFLLGLIVNLQAKCQESHDDDYGFISNLVTCLFKIIHYQHTLKLRPLQTSHLKQILPTFLQLARGAHSLTILNIWLKAYRMVYQHYGCQSKHFPLRPPMSLIKCIFWLIYTAVFSKHFLPYVDLTSNVHEILIVKLPCGKQKKYLPFNI